MMLLSPKFQLNYKGKIVLLVFLLLIIVILWWENLFFNAQPVNKKEETITKKTRPQQRAVKPKEQKQKRINLERIYGKKIGSKNNPFNSNQQEETAEFTYHTTKEKGELLNLKEIDSSLKLKGVINQSTAIISYNGQTALVKVGAEIGGYKVLAITGNKVTYLRQGKRYLSTLAVQNN